jgi:hypothetical protein
MRVFELMNELSTLPAGAKVFIHMIKHENELSVVEEDEDGVSYGIRFEVQEISLEDDEVELDAY